MKEKYDVVIVGAGPAGLAAAKYLAENNKEVLVLEKNKTVGDKLCAGGLTLKDFNEINLPFSVIEREFKSANLFINGRLIKIELEKPWIWTCNRKKLGEWQLKEAEKVGAKILLNAKVTEIHKNFVIVNKNRKVFYDYLIGADGSSSLVRKFLKIPTEKISIGLEYIIPMKDFGQEELEICIDLNKFSCAYAWIFPHKEHNWVGVGNDLRIMSTKKLKKNFDQWCNKKGIDTKKYQIKAALINYDYRGVKFGNIFLVGDASGITSGLTGEGIHPAIISGIEASRKIIDSNYNFKELKDLLKWKRFEERIIFIYNFNKTASKILFGFGSLLLKSHRIRKKMVDFFVLK